METKHIVLDGQNPDSQILTQAAAILKHGGLVAFPTETVYGLGANGLDPQAVAKIFTAKGRPGDNPLILHIANKQEVGKLAQEIPVNAQILMDQFWPGPLTIIFRRTMAVPDMVTGGLDTVAIRLPDCQVARRLIELAGVPLAAPSANRSGRPSPTTAQAVLADLNGKIAMVLDAGSCAIGLESTVVDCTTPVPTLLRPGSITREMLQETLGEIREATVRCEQGQVPLSPGMKYAHYAPTAPMILLEGEQAKLPAAIIQHVQQAMDQGKRVGAVVSKETAKQLPPQVVVVVYGPRHSVAEMAVNLYEGLRYFDDEPVDIIYAEGIGEGGLGRAVMNRLRKAAGYQIIKV